MSKQERLEWPSTFVLQQRNAPADDTATTASKQINSLSLVGNYFGTTSRILSSRLLAEIERQKIIVWKT